MPRDIPNDFVKYRSMWLFTMFDLPTDTKEARRRYTRFRKHLLNGGFMMLQYSVYAQYCESEEVSNSRKKYVRAQMPLDGNVRMLAVTDRQFGKMENYIGKMVIPSEDPPEQMLLF